jgi:hypothetical protein
VLALALTTAQGGCAVASSPPDEAHVGVDEQASPRNGGATAVLVDCYTSGSSYWCQDWYSQKWCTDAAYAYAWDWTGCNWSGWNNPAGTPTRADAQGTVDCSDGYSWGQYHLHCP